MVMVDDYGCAEKNNLPVLWSLWHIKNRKNSDLVCKKYMDVCVVMVWCVCAHTCDFQQLMRKLM